MLILIDLDGTLINTVHPGWKPYKDGKEGYNIESFLSQVPIFPGAEAFILSRKNKGDHIVVVSDSHFRYVNPICKMLDVECVSLADKPNTSKLEEFLSTHPDYKHDVETGNCIVIGDTKLDIEMGRHIGAKTIWFLPYRIIDEIKDERDGIGDDMLSKKMGPTFATRTFQELEAILDSPINYLYSIEASFAGEKTSRAIRLNDNKYADGSYACIRCLARQEQGACDKYARADKYYMMSNPQRTEEFLQNLASGISNYLNHPSFSQGWDYFTYLTDKRTTTPPNKMKEIFEKVETNIPKVQLLKWSDAVQGSLREQNLYADRQAFLQNYLSVECSLETKVDLFGQETQVPISLKGKNIIVLDDQFTTGATAWYVIRKLREKGAKNILFIAMFQMVLPVNNGIICPRCGKPMLIKMRRSDGHRFYSCTPPQYGGSGCGYAMDYNQVSNQDQKVAEIKSKYEWAFNRYKENRESLPNFKELVVQNEKDIALIQEMEMYNIGASDEDIKYMRELRQKVEELICSNPLRNRYWKEFLLHYSQCDYYDSFGHSIEYAINNLDELDSLIKQHKQL